ncbi:MAG: hypothetical protein RL141_872 [Candidatus Parcubacteria bacterium]
MKQTTTFLAGAGFFLGSVLLLTIFSTGKPTGTIRIGDRVPSIELMGKFLVVDPQGIIIATVQITPDSPIFEIRDVPIGKYAIFEGEKSRCTLNAGDDVELREAGIELLCVYIDSHGCKEADNPATSQAPIIVTEGETTDVYMTFDLSARLTRNPRIIQLLGLMKFGPENVDHFLSAPTAVH